ncbi:MAG: FMN-binding protein [Flavobacteriaceae bacterium]|nr:FMN-binding protein [Flavobacteriaceae bacterium]
MKYSSFLLLLVFGLLSFNYPKKMDKKISKEIKSSLGIKLFTLKQIAVGPDIKLPLKIVSESLFEIESSAKLVGYLYYGQGKGKAAKFDYIVIFDKDLIIAKIKLMVYRESYGGEIGSVRWLKQFVGLTSQSTAVYKKNIAAISGATISASSLTREVNKLLQSIVILEKTNKL